MTTHAWFSRRMHRLLQRIGVNSSLEEVPNKQHWWWDTKIDNDGGVLNDPHVRTCSCVYPLSINNNTDRIIVMFFIFYSSVKSFLRVLSLQDSSYCQHNMGADLVYKCQLKQNYSK